MHARLRALAIVSLVILTVVAHAGPAAADASGFGFTDKDGIGAGANRDDSTGGPGGSVRSTSPVRCEYGRLGDDEVALVDQGATSGWWNEKGVGPGAWFRKICFDDRGMSTATVIWIADRPDPAQLAEDALERVPVPAPAVRLNPTAERSQVVNVETWLSIDSAQWKSVSATASAGGVTVTTTASPERVVWKMGNGDEVVCKGPGASYDASKPAADQRTDCGYTYRRSSASAPGGDYQVSATVEWSVRWSALGAAGVGVLSPMSRTTTVPVRVAEIQTLNR